MSHGVAARALCVVVCMHTEMPRTTEVVKVEGFNRGMMQTVGMAEKSLREQRKWREDFEEEKRRIEERRAEEKAIHKIKDQNEREARMAEYEHKYGASIDNQSERFANLPDPVLYPLGERETGIPIFDLVMRVDIQVRFPML